MRKSKGTGVERYLDRGRVLLIRGTKVGLAGRNGKGALLKRAKHGI